MSLIVGDFRDHIPDDCWVVTDPPYNIGFKYPGFHDRCEDYGCIFEPLVEKRCVIINYPERMFEVASVLGWPEKCVAWCYNSNLARQWRMVCWFNCAPDMSRIRQPYKNMDDRRILELMSNGSDGPPLYDWWQIEQVKNVSAEKEPYVNQIPEEVIRRILLTTVPQGELVFDPFCGSGTTVAVAKRLGYKWVATDISSEAIAVADRRLYAPRLFEVLPTQER